ALAPAVVVSVRGRARGGARGIRQARARGIARGTDARDPGDRAVAVHAKGDGLMETAIGVVEMTIVVARMAFLVIGIGTAVGCALAWGVRTRRISPFSAVARVTRSVMDPLIGPVELRVIRAGGGGAAAPW